MAITPTYNIINSANIAQNIIDLLLGVANEAFRLWGEALAGDAELSVRVELLDTTSSGRAQGGWGNGTSIGQFDGLTVVMGAPAYELQTGENVPDNDYDIILQFSEDYLLNELFLDPTPGTRDDIPSNRTDGLSVLLHEIGHALGMIGYYNTETNVQGNFATQFDLRRVEIQGEDYFRGPNVSRVLNGEDLELTRNNYAHYGNNNEFPGTSSDPLTGLMNGVVFYRGYAYTIGELDLAVFADIGLGTILDDMLDAPLLTHMRGGDGNDVINDISGIDNFFFGDAGNDTLFGNNGSDHLYGGEGDDELYGGNEVDYLFGGSGSDLLHGGSNVDTVIVNGSSSGYDILANGTRSFVISRNTAGFDAGFEEVGTLIDVEFIQFDDQTIRLRPGEGISVNFETADPSVYQDAMTAIRDFDGRPLGGDGFWLRIGSADVNGDGDIDQILVNDAIGRFATVGTDENGLVYFEDYSWAGETRVVGTYIDPLVESGDVVAGSEFDSQVRFQNDLEIENINRVLGANDYDGDGIWEVYMALTDGTAYLRMLMHADGNIRYANYQSEQEVIDYLTANGFDDSTFGDWFTSSSPSAEDATQNAPDIVAQQLPVAPEKLFIPEYHDIEALLALRPAQALALAGEELHADFFG